ncbi:hypothetical protein D9758_010689 [Tetrapyrgos nigripes]|uniref:Cytochrome P450 n=1 Tax=Tetrapyrgos nigripes TaxID=182062 RepID=A0A8H5GGN8_9AGAR|nr:hypothetical protein D9758_010689 [Tetrapyrgos nigripes]
MSSNIIVPLLLLPVLFILYRSFRSRRGGPLPPGPKGLPFVGLLFEFKAWATSSKPKWKRYCEMSEKYNSDVVSFQVLGDRTVVLNSVKATTDLLEKRSSIYSDRPPLHMVDGLMGWTFDINHMRYNDKWRLHRKTFHQYFQPRSVPQYYPFERTAVTALFPKLLEKPDDLRAHIKTLASSLVLRVTYGFTTEEENEYFVALVDRAFGTILDVGGRGNYLVDYFPLLKSIPTWLPGAAFKRKALRWREYSQELRDGPWKMIRKSHAEGTAVHCFATENMDKFSGEMDEMEEIIRNCSASAYLAGSDTTVGLILSSILLLMYYPEVQKRAQAEIDAVIGDSRLPDHSDRERIPYTAAIITEALRIYPIGRLSFPHYTTEDDIYEGHFIPKGTAVLGNIWAILHDESIYPDPYKFDPERFVEGEGRTVQPHPKTWAFGFGRRICPGRWFALDTAYLTIACILATCHIKCALDENGNEIPAKLEYTQGLINHPKPYRARFVPRSAKALNLMKQGFEH